MKSSERVQRGRHVLTGSLHATKNMHKSVPYQELRLCQLWVVWEDVWFSPLLFFSSFLSPALSTFHTLSPIPSTCFFHHTAEEETRLSQKPLGGEKQWANGMTHWLCFNCFLTHFSAELPQDTRRKCFLNPCLLPWSLRKHFLTAAFLYCCAYIAKTMPWGSSWGFLFSSVLS